MTNKGIWISTTGLTVFLIGSCAAENVSRPPPEQAASPQVSVSAPPTTPAPPASAAMTTAEPPPTAAPSASAPVAEAAPEWKQLKGTAGSSDRWGSGWLDLETVRDFKEGTQLRLQLGGTAKTVAVRLLGVNQSPDDKAGIVGQYDVPNDKLLTVRLGADYERVKQISVHGKYAWNLYGGPKNGPATLLKVEVAERTQK